ELQENLKAIAEIAEKHSDVNQEKYVKYKNKRARIKSFEEGEKVIILQKYSNIKLIAEWLIGTILKKRSENSYFVQEEISQGTRIMHAKHLRKYLKPVDMIQREVQDVGVKITSIKK